MASESSNHLANLYSTNDQEIRDEAWLSTEVVYKVTWWAPRFAEEEEEEEEGEEEEEAEGKGKEEEKQALPT